MTTKTWTKDEIRKLLEDSDKAVARAILAIYGLQTADEQESEVTAHANGVGFNGVDAEFLSSLAKFYTTKGFLSPGQLKYGRKKIMKYTGQLVKIANNPAPVAVEADQYPTM